jgi:thiamine biosynthesis lipoprotein
MTDRQAIYRGRAIGTHVELLVTRPDLLVSAVHILTDELDRIDRLASRFREDSELTAVNRSGGRTVRISRGLSELVGVALRAAGATDGLVDPTVGAALCRLGYDRDFSTVVDGRAGELPQPAPVPGWQSVALDARRGTLRLPPGVMLDLGATTKAFASDRIAEMVFRTLGCGVTVSLGGDITVAGAPEGGFPIGVYDPDRPDLASASVSIATGGIATSGVDVRHWMLGHQTVHHIVDPVTGLPSRSVWRTATVCAASCVDANTASTAAIVMGKAAPAWLEARLLPARLHGVDGSIIEVGGWPTPTGRAALAGRGST